MDIKALNAALLDLAYYGIVLVRTQWDADQISQAAPVVTRVKRAGNLYAVEVTRGGGQAEEVAMASSGDS